MTSAFIKPVDPPYAERQLQIACALDEELKHLFFHPLIKLGVDEKGRDKYSVPDFADMELKVAFFLDGPSHRKAIREIKDDKIDFELDLLGWTPKRCEYDGRPLSKSKKIAIMRWMKRELANAKRLG